MPIDPVTDSSSLRQPETKKGSKADKSNGKKDFEKEAVLNRLLGDEDKRAHLKKRASEENDLQEATPADPSLPITQKGKYIDEMA